MNRYQVIVKGGANSTTRFLLKEGVESRDEAEKLAKDYRAYWQRHGHKTEYEVVEV